MAAGGLPTNRRRGERVLLRIPVKIYAVGEDGKQFNEAAETAVVSRFGALVRLAVPVKRGSTMEVMNDYTGQIEKFRVAWRADVPREGKYEVGIEFLAPRDEFWGLRFPEAPPKR
jgi:hypothetical protein